MGSVVRNLRAVRRISQIRLHLASKIHCQGSASIPSSHFHTSNTKSGQDVSFEKTKTKARGGNENKGEKVIDEAQEPSYNENEECNCNCWDYRKKMCIAASIGGIGALVAAPVALGVIGFKSAGIAAGSLAAGMMSWAATTGIGAGAVGIMQSAGAAGLGLASKVLIGASGTAVGSKLAAGKCDCPCHHKK